MRRLIFAWVLSSSLFLIIGAEERQFPVWNPARLSLSALWERSPIIAIGEVVNPVSYGEQVVQHLPEPVSENLHTLYWCQAEFDTTSVVKGRIITGAKKYLWASVNPGCRLFYGDHENYQRRTTRVWFLREDGEFLRPESDGSAFSYGLLADWSRVDNLHPKEALGELLLTPAANAMTLEDYSNLLWEVADFACSLLGKNECVLKIRNLSNLGSSSLRRAACQYLRRQQGETCNVP